MCTPAPAACTSDPPPIPEPLIGNNTDPPQPYNVSSVRSVVRWGTAAGRLSEEMEQERQLVYEYIYGESEWWGTLQAC